MYYVPSNLGFFYYILNFSYCAIAESDLSDTGTEPARRTAGKPQFDYSSSHTSQLHSTDTEKKTSSTHKVSAESSENVGSKQNYSGVTLDLEVTASSSSN